MDSVIIDFLENDSNFIYGFTYINYKKRELYGFFAGSSAEYYAF